MPRRTLDEWLAWQERIHPSAIDLRLERVNEILERLHWRVPPDCIVITVGGTNGKGSCVAFFEAILRAAGYSVGCYTSPHLRRYNERVRVDGVEASDDALVDIFERIESLRGELSLTYFEYGTVAALERFRDAAVDVMVLEVGLGGRLDAVNAVDAHAALVCAVDIDHVQWLGADRNSIGREKAGIYREGACAVCADPDPPEGLSRVASERGVSLRVANRDYHWRVAGDGRWQWWSGRNGPKDLPAPGLAGDFQYQNAAGVVAVLDCLAERLPVDDRALAQGLAEVRLRARFQTVPGDVPIVFDVAHNPQAAGSLADNLRRQPVAGRTLAVFGLLGDKDLGGILDQLGALMDVWFLADIDDTPRGLSAADLADMIIGQLPSADVRVAGAANLALAQAKAAAGSGDRIVVFGSFHLVAGLLPEGN